MSNEHSTSSKNEVQIDSREAELPNSGCVLGSPYPDWPEHLKTFEERKAYQLGVAHAKAALAHAASQTPEVEAEPVAYKVERVHTVGEGALTDDLGLLDEARKLGCKITPLYTKPQPQACSVPDEMRMNYLSNGGWEVLQDPKYWTDGLNLRQVIDRELLSAAPTQTEQMKK